MRQITKDIQVTVDGSPVGFRLFKLDAFSGVFLLRLLLRLENGEKPPTILDLISSLSEEELRLWAFRQEGLTAPEDVVFFDAGAWKKPRRSKPEWSLQ